VGVFPIRWQDADRLRDGLVALSEADPERAARVRERTASALTRLDPWFPGDVATGVLGESYEEAILFEEFANNEPCPALDLHHGTCDLYEWRPILCRTFGPPMRTEENDLATCELCYIEASTEEIERCELDPAISGLEEASNAAYEASTGKTGETLIAYALRGA
jgi:Fe-S-cluster containining protein